MTDVLSLFPENLQRETKTIQMADIQFSDIKIREAQMDHPKFLELKTSIQMQGLGIPIVVRPFKHEGRVVPGKYEGVDGCQRFHACKALGHTKIAATITDMTDDQVRAFQLSLNRNRVPQTKKQESDQLTAYMSANPTLTQKEVAQMFGMTPETLSSILGLQKLIPAATALLEEGKIRPTSATALSRLPEELQEMFLGEAQTMPTNQFIEATKAARAEFNKSGSVDKESLRHYSLMPKKDIESWLEKEEAALEMLPTDDQDYALQASKVNILQRVLCVDPETLAAKKAERDERNKSRSDEKLRKMLADTEAKRVELEQKLKAAEARNRDFAHAAV